MGRKTFYIFIAAAFSLICTYTLLRVLSFEHIPILKTKFFRDMIVVLIVIYEIYYAQKTVRTIGFFLISIAIIGFFFRIMHWPFGNLLFFGPALIIALVLIFNAIRSSGNSTDKLVIL